VEAARQQQKTKLTRLISLRARQTFLLQIMILKKNMHMEILMHIQELTKIVRTESIHLKTKISYSRILRTINLSTFLAVKETT